MKNPSDIITPPSLERRPKDRRGYPIPYVNLILPDGTPDFTAIHPELSSECARGRLCALCGEKVGYRIAFVGGPLGAKNRTYNDPGVHIECGHYAMIVCPYLAMQGTNYARHTKAPVVLTPGQSLHKPPASVMAITRSYEYDRRSGLYRIAKPTEIRVYPYGTDGAFYIPTPAVFAGLVAESLRIAREKVDADRATAREQKYARLRGDAS
jgi:hypothetical protein